MDETNSRKRGCKKTQPSMRLLKWVKNKFRNFIREKTEKKKQNFKKEIFLGLRTESFSPEMVQQKRVSRYPLFHRFLMIQ